MSDDIIPNLEEPEWAPQPPPASPFDSPKLKALGLPFLFLLAWGLNAVGIGVMSVLFYHEFGHGVAAWLCGRYAFPIPIAGLTFIGSDRSWFVVVPLFAGLAWLWNYARREDRYGLFTLTTALILALADFSLLADKKFCDMVILWGGSGGELILAALVLFAFHYQLSEDLRWDFWRWPLALTAACSLLFACQSWRRAQENPDRFILGGASTGSSRDRDADWVRLVNDHGWKPDEVVASYGRTAQACALAVALHYAVFLVLPARAPRRDEEGSAA